MSLSTHVYVGWEQRILAMCVLCVCTRHKMRFMRIYRDAKHTVYIYKTNRFLLKPWEKERNMEKSQSQKKMKWKRGAGETERESEREEGKSAYRLCNTPYDINHGTTMMMTTMKTTMTTTNSNTNPILYRFFPHFIAYAQNGNTFSFFLFFFFALSLCDLTFDF